MERIDASCNLFQNDTSPEEAQQSKVVSRFHTGADDLDQIDQYIEFEGQSSITGVWAVTVPVIGTDGYQNTPNNQHQDLVVWTGQMLRSLTFNFVEETSIYDLTLYKYRVSPDALSAPKLDYYQTIEGFANLTSMKLSVPIFLSKPNFYQADPYYANKIEGMQQPNDPDNYDIIIEIEPWTGSTMEAHQRFQINLFLNAEVYSLMDLVGVNVTQDTIYPIVSVDETSEVTEDIADHFYQIVFRARMIFNVSFYVGISVGSVACIAGVYWFTSSLWRLKKRGRPDETVNSTPNDHTEP